MKRREFLQSGLLFGAVSLGLIPKTELSKEERCRLVADKLYRIYCGEDRQIPLGEISDPPPIDWEEYKRLFGLK